MKTTSSREVPHSPSHPLVLLLTTLLSVCASNAVAQATAFTYQGRLTAGGAPAHGLYDLRFALYDAADPSANLLAGPLTNAATGVSNGLFTVTLDFGPGVFTGAARWLQIDVCTNGSDSFTPLDPRQALTPAPYAIVAGTVSAPVPASQLSGVVPLAQLPSALLTNSSTSATLAGAFSGSFGGSFSGDGSGLTNLDAAHFATSVLTNGQSGVTLHNATIDGDGSGITNVQNSLSALQLQGMVNVKTYGARGDGTTDDTAAVQAAADSLFPSSGSTTNPILYFPPGVYRLTQPIVFGAAWYYGATICGAGENYSTLVWPVDYVGDGLVFTNGHLKGFSIQKLAVVGPNTLTPGSNKGIVLGGADPDGGFTTLGWQLVVEHCFVSGWHYGITSSNNWVVNINYCIFMSNTVECVRFVGTHSSMVRNCLFTQLNNPVNCDIAIGYHAPNDAGWGDSAAIMNCNIGDFTNAIFNEELSLTTLNNNIERCGYFVAMVKGGTIVSIGDYFMGPIGFDKPAGMLFDAKLAQRCTFLNPSIDGLATVFMVTNGISLPHFYGVGAVSGTIDGTTPVGAGEPSLFVGANAWSIDRNATRLTLDNESAYPYSFDDGLAIPGNSNSVVRISVPDGVTHVYGYGMFQCTETQSWTNGWGGQSYSMDPAVGRYGGSYHETPIVCTNGLNPFSFNVDFQERPGAKAIGLYIYSSTNSATRYLYSPIRLIYR